MHPRWRPVADELAAVAAGDDVVGAALCLYEAGRPVVDIAAGWSDAGRTRVREARDRYPVFSATKGVVSALVATLVADGTVDLDGPVTALWPEFGAEGKDVLTVGDVMAHRAGVPAMDRRLTLLGALSNDTVANALAVQRPFWRPGRGHGYHAITWGPLLVRIVERATGGDFLTELDERVVSRLGARFTVGEPPADDGGGQLQALIPAPTSPAALAAIAALRSTRALAWRAMTLDGLFEDPDGFAGVAQWPQVRRAVLAASGGVSDARALAHVFAALVGEVDGVRLVPADVLSDMIRPRSRGLDRCLVRPSVFGAGFARRSPSFTLPFATSFGHTGVGGVVCFADPGHGLAGAYVPSRASADVSVDPAWRRLSRVIARVVTDQAA